MSFPFLPYLMCETNRIPEKEQVVLSHPDDITGAQPDGTSQNFTVPRDHSILTGAEPDRATNTVALEGAVLWEDVASKEGDVNLCLVFVSSVLTHYHMRSSQQVDDKVLRRDYS